jgi:UDP-N-acetylmuramate--alanine ligase
VWEPHTFSRIRALYADFMQSFASADTVMVLPIYAAREEIDSRFTSGSLAADIQHDYVEAAESMDDGVEKLIGMTSPGDVVMLMGAGNEYIVGQRLLEQLGTAQ